MKLWQKNRKEHGHAGTLALKTYKTLKMIKKKWLKHFKASSNSSNSAYFTKLKLCSKYEILTYKSKNIVVICIFAKA